MRLTLAAILAFGVGVGAQAQVYTIATNPQGSLYYTAASGIVKVAHDIRPVPVTNAFQGTEMVGAGRADAALTAPGTAQAQKVHAELGSRGGARFLPIDDSPAAVARMRKSMNSYPLTIQPARHLPGIVEPTVVMGFSSFMVTHDKVPEELVYKFTKMLHESRNDIVAIVPLMQRFDPAKMSERHVVPYHPGAIKFYSEVAQWPPKQ